MKKSVFISRLDNEDARFLLKFLVAYKDSILLGLVSKEECLKELQYVKNLRVFIPIRLSKDNIAFYKDDGAKFIAGLAREHGNISLVIDKEIPIFIKALDLEENLFDYIEDILLINCIDKDIDLLKSKIREKNLNNNSPFTSRIYEDRTGDKSSIFILFNKDNFEIVRDGFVYTIEGNQLSHNRRKIIEEMIVKLK